jgi:hypothetical protein
MRVAPLDWTADPPGVTAERHLHAFRVLLLAHWVVQAWAWWVRPLESPFTYPELPLVAGALALTALLALAFTRHARVACALAFPIAVALVGWIFPGTPNHTFLAVLLLGLFAWFDLEREDDSRLLLQALRWMTVIVFFWAGAQKALNGLYFRGEFLSWMIAQSQDHWAAVFGWLVPVEEIERLRALPRFYAGAGPYRVAAWPFLLVSNGVWIGEIVLAGLMLTRRFRHWAALAAIGLVVMIQSAPHEWMFALLYSQLLLLFVPGEWNRRLLPVFLGAYAWLLATLAGVAPGASWLIKAGGYL